MRTVNQLRNMVPLDCSVHEIPKIDAIVVDKPGLNVACGAIGIGEITSIPTAPAIADAYFRYDGRDVYVCRRPNTI